MIAQEILADLESQGARFWEENGALRYSAPKGLMDQERRQQLAAVKEQLLPLLRKRGNGEGNLSITTIKPDPTRLHEPFPLNDMQAAYLVGGNELFETGNISCHAYIELYKDNIEIECLRVAWNALIARHPMLHAVTLPGGKQQISVSEEARSAPATIRMSSVLPAPTRPARPRISPARRVKETPLTSGEVRESARRTTGASRGTLERVFGALIT